MLEQRERLVDKCHGPVRQPSSLLVNLQSMCAQGSKWPFIHQDKGTKRQIKDKETRRQGDDETRRRRDKETRRQFRDKQQTNKQPTIQPSNHPNKPTNQLVRVTRARVADRAIEQRHGEEYDAVEHERDLGLGEVVGVDARQAQRMMSPQRPRWPG